MTKPKCKTCARLRREAKEDATFIAQVLLEKMGLLDENRILKERINHLNGEILKQPFAMPWRTEPVERPKTAFIIENPVITFPPETVTGNSADPAERDKLRMLLATCANRLAGTYVTPFNDKELVKRIDAALAPEEGT